MQRRYRTGESEVIVDVAPAGESYRVTVGERTYTVTVRHSDNSGALTLDIDGQQWRAVVASDGVRRWVALGGQSFVLEPPQARGIRSHAAANAGTITAAMPGQVLALYVAAGEVVAAGQPLALLVAMKMELTITAPAAGQVRTVLVAPGDNVARGQPLIDLA